MRLRVNVHRVKEALAPAAIPVLRIGTVVVIALTCVFIWHVPTAGKAGLLLAAVVALMALKAEIGSLHRGEAVMWMVVIFVLLVIENRAINKDRQEQADKQQQVLTEERGHFGEIGSGIEGAIRQSQQHFDATMKKEEELRKESTAIAITATNSLKNITGGDSYPKISPQPAKVGEPIYLALWDMGKYIMTGVTVTLHDPNDYGRLQEFAVGTVHPGWPRMLPISLIPKLGEDGTAKYFFDVYTQTGLFSAAVQIREGKGTQAGFWAYQKWGTKQLFDRDAVAYWNKHFPKKKEPLNKHMSVGFPIYNDGWSDEPQPTPPKKQ